MAEMDTSGGGGHKKGPGVKKAKKLSTRVDLTPMVDLGFLLITFFIFTTTMAMPNVMKLHMPDDSPVKDPLLASEEKTLTVLVGSNNRLFFYPGLFDGRLSEVSYKELREKIIEKKH